MLYQLQSRTDEVIAAYRAYLGIAIEDGEAHHNLGLFYMTKGLRDEAAVALAAAAQHLSSDDAEQATNLGVGYFFRGELDRAVELLEQTLNLDASVVSSGG